MIFKALTKLVTLPIKIVTAPVTMAESLLGDKEHGVSRKVKKALKAVEEAGEDADEEAGL